MKQNAFRAYDIRGIVDEDFRASDILQLGKAFASLLENRSAKKVVVGRDARLSSPLLAKAFMEGLLASGINVFDCGLVPTPLLYYSSNLLAADGAVMVTASHNPPQYNGFKLMLGTHPLCGEELQKLFLAMRQNKPNFEKGSIYSLDYTEEYLRFLQKDFYDYYGGSSLRVAWDPGNGTTAPILQQLLPKLPGTHFIINETVDGTFPDRPSDPTNIGNLKQLVQVVMEYKCDFGIAFDGDGDRLSVIDKHGRLLLADQFLPIFAGEVLKAHPGAKILVDVKSSSHLLSAIKKLGGVPLLSPCGHSNVKIKMKELKSPLGGEMSGHVMFSDRAFGFDDAIYAGLRFFGILSKMTVPLEDWVDKQPERFISHLIKIPTSKKFKLIQLMNERMLKQNKTFLSIDGIRFESNRGWWLVRASHTEECIVCRVEGITYKDMCILIEDLIEMLKQIGLKESNIRNSWPKVSEETKALRSNCG